MKIVLVGWERRVDTLSGHILRLLFAGLVLAALLELDIIVPVLLGH